ncbi:MAG TPA: hypothetical protein VGZ22_19025, partial [Isosphaeraceae bacterium]|nr:hypothetical protein [Isosphaeraceae bacterium]
MEKVARLTQIEPDHLLLAGHGVLFFGGNGHCDARLERAAAALNRHGSEGQDRGAPHAAPEPRPERLAPDPASGTRVRLLDVPYPGFEGRPRAASLEVFLAQVKTFCDRHDPQVSGAMATGIGGLIALSLRARGSLRIPLILQAPVLWGLERRWLPSLLRWRGFRGLLPVLFSRRWFQQQFARRHFLKPVEPALLDRFFAGYAQCSSLPDLFAWFTPAVLRDLELRFTERPEALSGITVWWGGCDGVLDLAEL